jgi:hypothetical protein
MTKALVSLLAAGMLVSLNTQASNPALGMKLPLKTNPNGAPTFGAVYTYDNDPTGSNYLLTLSSSLTDSQFYQWNFFSATNGYYLLNWSPARKTSAAAVQIRVQNTEIVSRILAGQKKTATASSLYFVLADDNNAPIYYLDISEICAAFPANFKNLTDTKGCDQF